jgi:ribonuclease P protein component
VTGATPVIERLKRRRDFLAAARGFRAARRAFALEGRQRDDAGAPRFGFTVSKRTAPKAVERNRIRRRLKEAVRLAAPPHAKPGCDYVLVGRRAALTEDFARIASDLAAAMIESESRASRPSAGARKSSG